MAIVTAKLMSEVALEFNIGADLLSKSNRAVEKNLGAEKMSGDTVWVPIAGGGDVYRKMDLTDKDLSVDRDNVPVTVRPIVTAAAVTQEELLLSIKNPEIMSKRVAQLADTANQDVYKTIIAGSQAFVANVDGLTGEERSYAIRQAAFDAQANTEASKFAGETYGVTHPFTWNRINLTLQTNFAPNDKRGNDLYRNELGNFMGFNWTRAGQAPSVKGVATSIPTISSITSGQKFSGTAPTTDMYGRVVANIREEGVILSQPFTLEGVYNVDLLGNRTGELKTFTLKAEVTRGDDGSFVVGDWDFAITPVFVRKKGRHNCWIDGVSDNPEASETYSTSASAVLKAGTQYLAPASIYKKNDLLVAVKGMEKFYGCDSFTLPTNYRDKGILPLRGTAWTDPIKASTIFRVDVMMGSSMFTGLSASSIWIPQG